MNESISGFLECVAKHPALTNDKDAMEPGHKEECCKLYVKLLEKVFDFFDNIPKSLKENIPEYDRKIFEKVKILQVKLKQILDKLDTVVAQESQSLIENEFSKVNGKNEVDKGSRPHSIFIENEGHSSSTKPWTLQGLKNDLLFKMPSSLGASSSFNNSSCSLMTSQGKGEIKRFSNKPSSFRIENIESMSNRYVPSSNAEGIRNAPEILKPLNAIEKSKYAPVAGSSSQFQPSYNRKYDEQISIKPRNDVPYWPCLALCLENDANITPASATVNKNSVSVASGRNEEGNGCIDVDEHGWQQYREEDFGIKKRNVSEQVKGKKEVLFKDPSRITVEPSNNVPIRNAPEILKPLTAIETSKSKYVPLAGSSTQFQLPQQRKYGSHINTKHRHDMRFWHIENDANITPSSTTFNNNSVSVASGRNEEVDRYIDVDEHGWQRYREEDFGIEKRNLSEQVKEQREVLFKNPSKVTVEPSKNVPIRNASEILKLLTAIETSKSNYAPVAGSSTQFQTPHKRKYDLQNSSKPRNDIPYWYIENDANITPSSATFNNNSFSVASGKIEEVDGYIDVDEHGWQRYREDDFGIEKRNLETVSESVYTSDAVASNSKVDIMNTRCLDIHIDEDGWPEYRPEDFEENIEDMGSQNPQEVNMMEEFEDVNYHANIQNDGLSGEFDGFDYPHSSLMMEVLRESFGLTSFRPNQLQVINATLLGHDCFVLMPTGSGKSLCYQLPALLMPGVTIVISPLKALILDQVNKLLSLHIPVAHLSGDLSQPTCDEVYHKLSLREPALKLLYVTPEKISCSNRLKSMLSDLYSRGKLARFVIDEAHCVSQWGHDFRPDYKRLSVLRAQFPQTSIIALTATATPRVRTDILHQLQVRSCKWFLSSFDRPNLTYRILEKNPRSINQDVIAVIKEQFAGLSGIVYCLSRKDCEKLSTDLGEAGVRAAYYHGGLSDHARAQVQDHWLANRCQVICATIAFGMGVDKADVRYVIHHSMPKSVEGYYQEAGRAGRDGDVAVCLLYYCFSDVMRYKRMIYMDRTNTPQTTRMHLRNLMSMVKVCEGVTECRRAQVLAYLGEHYERERCARARASACDNCVDEHCYEQVDMSEVSKLIVRSIHENSSAAQITLLQIADVLRGSMQVRLQALQNSPLHGRLSHWSRADLMRLLRQLVVNRFLVDEPSDNDNNPNTYVEAGPYADKLLSGELRILFAMRVQPALEGGAGAAASKRARL